MKLYKNFKKRVRSLFTTKRMMWKMLITRYAPQFGDRFQIDRSGKYLHIDPIGIDIDEGKTFFIRSFQIVQEILGRVPAKFSIRDNGIVIQIDGTKMKVETEEDLYICYEIFARGFYNFITKEPMVVWDIGLNTGIAALYFAGKPNVEKVVGYEPFGKTYKDALYNLNLNAWAAAKVEVHQLGIGDKDYMVEAFFDESYKGSSGLYLRPRDKADEASFLSEQIHLVPAIEALQDIKDKHPGRKILAKIDCEGSEFQILRSLYQARKLKDIDYLVMETHQRAQDHDPQELVDYLVETGFTVVFLDPTSKTEGLVYAFK